MHDAPLAAQTLGDFLESLAARTPAPGGGATACVAGALAAAQARMVVAYSLGKKTSDADRAELQPAADALAQHQTALLASADEDAAAYSALSALMKRPEDDPARQEQWGAAVEAAVSIPLEVAERCHDLLRIIKAQQARTNPRLASDLAIAALLAETAVASAVWNVRINLPLLDDPQRRRTLDQTAAALVEQAGKAAGEITRRCGQTMAE